MLKTIPEISNTSDHMSVTMLRRLLMTHRYFIWVLTCTMFIYPDDILMRSSGKVRFIRIICCRSHCCLVSWDSMCCMCCAGTLLLIVPKVQHVSEEDLTSTSVLIFIVCSHRPFLCLFSHSNSLLTTLRSRDSAPLHTQVS